MFKKVICLFFICMISVRNLFAFGGHTHEALTECALKNNFSQFNINKFDKEGKLKIYCNLPDQDLKLGKGTFFKSHFFEPNKVNNDFREKFGSQELDLKKIDDKSVIPDNAADAVYMYFWQALEKCDRKNDDEAVKYLGMAIHYAQDMCCFAHQKSWYRNIWDAVSLKHSRYESKIDYFTKEVGIRMFGKQYNRISDCMLSLDNKKFARFISLNIVTYVKKMIEKINNENLYQKKGNELNEIGFAYRATCELIYAFCKKQGIRGECMDNFCIRFE